MTTDPDFFQLYLDIKNEIALLPDFREKRIDPVTAMVYYVWKYRTIHDARAIHKLLDYKFDMVIDRLIKLGFVPLAAKVPKEKKRVVVLNIPETKDVVLTEEEKLAGMMIG